MSESQLGASFVVTGGLGGVGRAIVDRLAAVGHVVVIDRRPSADLPERVRLVTGDAADPEVAAEAARLAEGRGRLVGWVNNAAVFGDAGLLDGTARDILDLITANLAMAVTGCHAAVRHFHAHSRGGAIVETERYDRLLADRPEVAAQMAALHPLARVGTAAEAAEVVAFLLSEASGFVSGAVIPVDGGRAAYGPDPEATS